MLANQLHAHLNPLEEALACRRLLDTRLNRKEVAAKLEMTQATVKERLAILELPEALWPKVAGGRDPAAGGQGARAGREDPPGARAQRVAAVLDATGSTSRTRGQRSPRDRSRSRSTSSSSSRPVCSAPARPIRWSPSRSARRQPRTSPHIPSCSGATLTTVRFDHDDVEVARLLNAAHNYGWGWLIVGQDVGDRLVEDNLAKALGQEQARHDREREREKAPEAGASEQDDREGQPARQESAAEQEWRHEQEAKAARQAEREERDRAIQYNLDLGVLALKHLRKIKVDEQVLRILASVHVTGDLRGLAARGARLALPGWPTQTRQRNGRLKTDYLDPEEAEHRAGMFLQDAAGAGDIAGRSLTLLALASLADENAIARSRRSHYGLSFKGPWARQAEARPPRDRPRADQGGPAPRPG